MWYDGKKSHLANLRIENQERNWDGFAVAINRFGLRVTHTI